MWKNRIKAETVHQLAIDLGMQAGSLKRTIEVYNRQDAPDAFGKAEAFKSAIVTPPFYAINMGARDSPKYWPTPCMSLGGLRVCDDSGMVLTPSGKRIEGVYAVGRASSGIASNYYISGLSLGDCLFSGRRAGKWISKL